MIIVKHDLGEMFNISAIFSATFANFSLSEGFRCFKKSCFV